MTAMEYAASITGIPEARLKEMKDTGNATLAEMRDLAMAWGTSVVTLQGHRNAIGDHVSMHHFIAENRLPATPQHPEGWAGCGFWGHIGIRLSNSKEYVWHPISAQTFDDAQITIANDQYAVIPCMDNRLLVINMDEVDDIVLLDEACDPPHFTNWDYDVSEGEIPGVIYEALPDYINEGDDLVKRKEISPRFAQMLDGLIREKGWEDGDIPSMFEKTFIHFVKGNTTEVYIDFEDNEQLCSFINLAWNQFENDEKVIGCTTLGDAVYMLVLSNIAMLDIPLAAYNKAIINFDIDGEDDFVDDFDDEDY